MIEIKVTRQHASGYGKTTEIFLREIVPNVDIFKGDVPAAQKADAGYVSRVFTNTGYSTPRI